MRYELIREIFNKCSGNQMRDVFVSTVETDDTEAYLRSQLVGTEISVEATPTRDGVGTEISVEATPTRDGVIYDVVTDGLHQRFSFTED